MCLLNHLRNVRKCNIPVATGFFSPNVFFETTEKHTYSILVGIIGHHKHKTWTMDILILHFATRLPPKLSPQELLVFRRIQRCVCGDWRRRASPPLDPWRPLASQPRPSAAKVWSRGQGTPSHFRQYHRPKPKVQRRQVRAVHGRSVTGG